MTLVQVTTQLVGIFCQDHIFTRDNFAAIKIDDKLNDNKDAIILAALNELCSNNIIKCINDNMWMLVAPPGTQGQEIRLSLGTSTILAETINDFAEANKIDIEHVSPLSLGEEDVLMLLNIIHDLISEDK